MIIPTRHIHLRTALLLAASLLAGACATPAPEPAPPTAGERVWPQPPAQARIRFEKSFHTPADLGIGKSVWSRIGEFLTGRETRRMVRPMAIAATLQGGRILVADPGARGVHLFDTEHHRYRLLGRAGRRPLPSPVGLASDASGRAYLTDSVLTSVLVLEPGETEFTPLNLDTPLLQPTGIAVRRDGSELYVVDTGEHDIKVFSPRGRLLRRFGGRGNGPGAFNFPTGIWLDGGKRLLVTDSLNFRIQVLDTSGRPLGRFGRAGDASGTLARPKGVATDSFGHVYVVDSIHHAIQIFDLDGRLLLEVGEQGRDDGRFWLPTGIFIATDDRIYVADSHNRRVQVFRYIGGKP